MAAAAVEKKARELLDASRVKLTGRGGRGIYFSVQGETGEHEIFFTPTKGTWSCDCKYSSLKPSGVCSHVLAAKLFFESLEKPRA
jgi:hypothetical protein